jgi:hypothetical protein
LSSLLLLDIQQHRVESCPGPEALTTKNIPVLNIEYFEGLQVDVRVSRTYYKLTKSKHIPWQASYVGFGGRCNTRRGHLFLSCSKPASRRRKTAFEDVGDGSPLPKISRKISNIL